MIYTKQEWYTPAEVAIHNTPTNCWVILNGKVLDMTKWLEEQFRRCKCTKTCSCAIKNWYCDDNCVEHCRCFDRGFFYCDAKRVGNRLEKRPRYGEKLRKAATSIVVVDDARLIMMLAMTIVSYAGKDISHWFRGDEWVQYVHPIVGSRVPYQIHGPGLNQPVVPSTRWRPIEKPWWLDESIVVGKATARTRPIKITNTVTSESVTLEVCSEETIYQIMMRYMPHNTHLHSYTWRYMGKPLCYEKNLADNGIPDERDRFGDVALPENIHVPAILIYYNDNLTEGPPPAMCFCKDFNCLENRPYY